MIAGIIISALVTIAMTVWGIQSQRDQNLELANLQNDYNTEAQDKQNEFIRETNRSNSIASQWEQLQALGINPHYAAQYLTHNTAVAQQSVAKQAPQGINILGALSGLAGQLNTSANNLASADARSVNADIQRARLDIERQNANIKSRMADLQERYYSGKITQQEYQNEMTKLVDNTMFTDPRTGVVQPFWLWKAQHEVTNAQSADFQLEMERLRAQWDAETHEVNMELLRTKINNMIEDNMRADQQQGINNDKYWQYEKKRQEDLLEILSTERKAKDLAYKILDLNYQDLQNEKVVDRFVNKEIDEAPISDGSKVALKVLYRLAKGWLNGKNRGIYYDIFDRK